ncbi:MAG: 2-C-methyl-D-erythritol 4-phosphate cytidylyltransferase [Anaerovoracaceae bacterium]
MVIAAVLAGGAGRRMGNGGMPKQFLEVGGRPILIITLEKFCACSRIDCVVTAAPAEWVGATEDLIAEYGLDTGRVHVTAGGKERNDSLMNVIDWIDGKFGVDDDTILLTHDAVRPFVTERIIEENIDLALNGCVCDTVVPSTDTIVVSEDGETASSIPDRSKLFRTQTPQTFRAALFRKLYSEADEEKKSRMTDAIGVFLDAGIPVKLVRGEEFNIKVTYPSDLAAAEAFMKDER